MHVDWLKAVFLSLDGRGQSIIFVILNSEQTSCFYNCQKKCCFCMSACCFIMKTMKTEKNFFNVPRKLWKHEWTLKRTRNTGWKTRTSVLSLHSGASVPTIPSISNGNFIAREEQRGKCSRMKNIKNPAQEKTRSEAI